MAVDVYRSRVVRLPDFMWQALDLLAGYANEQAVLSPEERINVSGLLQAVVLSSIKAEFLHASPTACPSSTRPLPHGPCRRPRATARRDRLLPAGLEPPLQGELTGFSGHDPDCVLHDAETPQDRRERGVALSFTPSGNGGTISLHQRRRIMHSRQCCSSNLNLSRAVRGPRAQDTSIHAILSGARLP